LLDSFQADDFVKIDINLRGREWTNQQGELKYFNSIQGWRIEKVVDEFESQLPPLPTKEDLNIPDSSTNEPDDLPF
jgi:translation initiation factor IF-3